MNKSNEQAAFTIQEMLPIGLTIVVLGIALAYGLQVTGDVRDDIGAAECAARTDGYTAYDTNDTSVCFSPGDGTNTSGIGSATNATSDAITGISKLPEKLPTIVGVVVAAIIIGIVIRYFMQR